jgi:hypothetical protein
MELQPDEINAQWEGLLDQLGRILGKRPADVNAVLFLVGVQELGQGARNFTKEQKQDLIHIGICRVLSPSGYYQFAYTDADGWPHYQLAKKLPHVDILSQELLLKSHILRYFQSGQL